MSSLTIQDIKQQHENFLMKIPGVIGVGLGVEEEEQVIVVLVSKKSRRMVKKIPAHIEGFRIILRETGIVRAY